MKTLFHKLSEGDKFHLGKNASKSKFESSFRVYVKTGKSQANLIEIHMNNGSIQKRENHVERFQANSRVFSL